MTAATTSDDKARSDLLDERSEDATVIQGWVAPGHAITFVLTPEAQVLADCLQPLAKAILALRESINSARRQTVELSRVWPLLRGLSTIAAIHVAYNGLVGLVPNGGKELSAAANALLDKCSKSPPFLQTATDGDVCMVNVLAINKKLQRDLNQQISDVDHYLNAPELKAAYDAIVKTEGQNPNLTVELMIANLIIGDAYDILFRATPFSPNEDTTQVIKSAAQLLDSVMDQPIARLQTDPGAGNVLDVALPAWHRVLLANAANAAGAATPGVGPDHLLLKLTIWWMNHAIPKVMDDPAKAKHLAEIALPALHEALGLDKAEAEKEFGELLEKSKELSAARAELKVQSSRPDVTPEEITRLKKKVADADVKNDEELRRIKTEYLDDKVHLHDGAVANLVLTILAGLQLGDAIASLDEARKAHNTRAEWKSGADTAGAVLSIGSTAPAVLVRLANGEVTWLDSALRVTRGVGKYGVPVASALSGSLQAIGGWTDGNASDILVGGLNVIYGGAFLAYAVWDTVFILPVIGQTAAFLAFATSLVLAAKDAETPMTKRFFLAALDTIANTRWSHGDPEDQKALADALGFQAEFALLGNAIKGADFYQISVPAGMTRDSVVDMLSAYTRQRSVADAMVRTF